MKSIVDPPRRLGSDPPGGGLPASQLSREGAFSDGTFNAREGDGWVTTQTRGCDWIAGARQSDPGLLAVAAPQLAARLCRRIRMTQT